MRPQVNNRLDAPTWSNDAVVAAAGRLAAKYESVVGRDYILTNGLHFDDVYAKVLYPQFGTELYEDLDLEKAPDGRKVLGRYDVATNTVYLDRLISRESGDPRRVFTCWHEVAGHGALQGEWLRKRLQRTGFGGVIDATDVSLSAAAEQRLERQANLFAAHLAAPDWLVHYAVRKIFRPNRVFPFTGPCDYWLDVQGWRSHKFVTDATDLQTWIGAKISGYFGGLSDEAIGYRIAELGWVKDSTSGNLRLYRTARGEPAPMAESFDFSNAWQEKAV